MFCKNCKAELKSGQKYCSYCGTKVEEDNSNKTEDKNTYEDPFKDYRIDNNSHQDQYNYQQQYSGNIPYKDNSQIKYKEPELYKSNNMSVLACIFIVLGGVSLFFIPLLSILFGILALVFGIIGRRHTFKTFGTIVLIFSIFSFICNLILGPIVFIGTIEVTIASYRTTLFDYFISAFQNGFNESKLYDSFYSKEGHKFELNEYYEKYYLYNSEDNMKTKYFVGDFKLDDGIYKNGDTLYEDESYYYYTLKPSNPYYVDETGKKLEDTILFVSELTIKLNKKDKSKIILYSESLKFNVEFTRDSKSSSNSLPTT